MTNTSSGKVDFSEKIRELATLTDLMERVEWQEKNPPPTIKVVCANCASSHKFQLNWGDVEREVKAKRAIPAAILTRSCSKCDDEESQDD
jgi:hypothetical protein